VEPGTGSGVFGDPQFWDFVIVEGSNDGINWQPLVPGYDARLYSDWLSVYNNGAPGIVPDLFKRREINVLDTFIAGEQILLRFRLSADPAVNGFGWVIDNLQIFNQQATLQLTQQTLFPWVSQNQDFESILVINNPSDQSVTYTLTALREGGRGERSAVRSLGPRQFLAETPRDLFPTIGDGSGLSILLECDSSAVKGRWVTNNLTAATGASPSQGVGVQVNAALAGASQRAGNRILFNYLPQSAGLTAAPVVVNLGSEPTDVTLSFYTRDGVLLRQDTETLTNLTPHRPFARILSSLVNSGGEDVYLIAESSGQPLTGVSFVFNAEGETSIGNVAAVIDENNAPSNLLYAWISNNEDFESVVVANNLSNQSAEVSMSARRADGSFESTTRTIPGGGFLAEEASTLFPALAAGNGYTVALESSSSQIFGAWVTNNLRAASGQSPAQGVAVNLTDSERAGREILYGYLPGSEGFTSAPVVVNLSPEPIDVDLTFYNRAGEIVYTQKLQALDTNQPFAVVAQELISGLSEDVYMTARASSGIISGVAFIFNRGSEPAIGNVDVLE
jgi:hypothetical protein